jgi:hypothetical protein
MKSHVTSKALSLLIIFFASLYSRVVLPFAEAEKEGYSIEAIGAGRLIGAFMHFPDVPGVYPEGDDSLQSGVFRTILSGDLKEKVTYELNFYADLTRTPEGFGTGGAFATVGSFETPYRTPYLQWDYWENGKINGQLGLDRLLLGFTWDRLSISVGRYPINYSVTQVFTPNDFFAPFSATAINKIYKPGVDALRFSFAPGLLSTIELVGVMGKDDDDIPSWSQSALLLRTSAVFLNFEWTLLGGKLAERWMVGAALQGEVGPISIRSEGHAGFPDSGKDLEGPPIVFGNIDI